MNCAEIEAKIDALNQRIAELEDERHEAYEELAVCLAEDDNDADPLLRFSPELIRGLSRIGLYGDERTPFLNQLRGVGPKIRFWGRDHDHESGNDEITEGPAIGAADGASGVETGGGCAVT